MPTFEEITRHSDDDGTGAWVGGPPESDVIRIVEPDPSWPDVYEQVAGRIRTVLGDRVLALEHVGSTSVPGLAAKPIIDIDLTVADSGDEASYVPALESVGFVLRIREPGWHEHRCLQASEPRVNLHVWGPDAPEPIRHRMFRDWLRDHPDDRERYAEVKWTSAAESNTSNESVMAYNKRKEPVIRDILDRMFRAYGMLAPPSSSDHPSTWKFGYSIYHAESRAQWRAWLAANHDAAPGVWLCSWKSSTGRPTCPYPEVVEEALCFGWIDSTVNVLDDERALQLVTPRKAKSTWTRLNRRRVEEMDAAGLMTDAGRRVVDVAKANGWWTIYEPVEASQEPDDLAAALDNDERARASWDRFRPSARKQMLWWVISAVKPETRTQRIEVIVDKASRGECAQG